MSLREKVFALDVLSSDLQPAGFDESKRAGEAEDESVAEESVKLEEIVDWAEDTEEVDEAEIQSPEDLGVRVGRPTFGGLLTAAVGT